MSVAVWDVVCNMRMRPSHKKPDKEEGGHAGSRSKALSVTNISEASVLFVDVEFGKLSAIFLAATIGSYSALTPTLYTFCQTLSVSHSHI